MTKRRKKKHFSWIAGFLLLLLIIILAFHPDILRLELENPQINNAWHCSPVKFFTVGWMDNQGNLFSPRSQYDVPKMLREIHELLNIEITETGIEKIFKGEPDEIEYQYDHYDFAKDGLMPSRTWGPNSQFCSLSLTAIPNKYPGSTSVREYPPNQPYNVLFSFPISAYSNCYASEYVGEGWESYNVARTGLAHELGHLAFGFMHCADRACIMGMLIPDNMEPWGLCPDHLATTQTDLSITELIPEKSVFCCGSKVTMTLICKSKISLHYNLEVEVNGVKYLDIDPNNLVASDSQCQIKFAVPQTQGGSHMTIKLSVSDAHELNKANNIIIKIVTISKAGDVNVDGKCNILDIAAVAKAYNTKRGSIGYVANLDQDTNGLINILDVSSVARSYGF